MKSETEKPEVHQPSDKKAPGFWLYTADYERDMQILSLAAQGLWSRMLCWMSDNEAHRGFLELPTGAPMEVRDVAARVGKSPKEVERSIAEMERIGTFSRDGRGCIYCRRMARDTHISDVRRQAAKSRMDSAKRAADGTFAGDFAGAKQASKSEQNPTVTASVSVPVSFPDSSSKEQTAAAIVELPRQSDFPQTDAAIRRRCPTADLPIVVRITEAATREYLSVDGPKIPPPDDAVIAAAVEEAARQTPKQTGPGLFLRTVPAVIRSWAELGRHPPPARSQIVDPVLEAGKRDMELRKGLGR